MSVAEELQVTEGRPRVVPSPKVPVAVNSMVAATPTEGFVGVTAMDVNLFAEEPDMPEHADMDIAAAIATKDQRAGIATRNLLDTTPPCAGVEGERFC